MTSIYLPSCNYTVSTFGLISLHFLPSSTNAALSNLESYIFTSSIPFLAVTKSSGAATSSIRRNTSSFDSHIQLKVYGSNFRPREGLFRSTILKYMQPHVCAWRLINLNLLRVALMDYLQRI